MPQKKKKNSDDDIEYVELMLETNLVDRSIDAPRFEHLFFEKGVDTNDLCIKEFSDDFT